MLENVRKLENTKQIRSSDCRHDIIAWWVVLVCDGLKICKKIILLRQYNFKQCI